MLSASAGDEPRTDPAAAAPVLVRALADEVHRTGFRRGIVGLSGGIDSAVSLLLGAKALGPENMTAVALPVAGVDLRVVDLSPVLAALEKALPPQDRVRRGNLAARARMIALYDLSAVEKALVVGTSNKTEILLGYSTLWGDMAAAIQPLGDLYKCEVRALARHLGVPAPIIDKAPSADLWDGQTDEGELGFTYDDADRVLYQWLDCGRMPADLVKSGVPEPLFRAI